MRARVRYGWRPVDREPNDIGTRASSFLDRARGRAPCIPGIPFESKGGGTDALKKCASTRTVIFHRLGRTDHAGPLAEAQDAVHDPLASRPAVAEVSPQTPAKAGGLRAKRVRGGPARVLAISLAQRSSVSRAWRTTLPTVFRSRKRSCLGRAVCNSSGKPTRL